MKDAATQRLEEEKPVNTGDILGDKAVSEAVENDPLFKFIGRFWRQLLVVAIAAFAGYFGNQFFNQSYADSMKRAGDLFSAVRAQISTIDTMKRDLAQAEKDRAAAAADDKKSAEDKMAAEKKVTESREKLQQADERAKELLLALSDSRKPYSVLAGIYKGLFAAQSGDIETARSSLSRLNWEGLAADSQERFFAETGTMGLAGALLDGDKTYVEGRSVLKSLAEKGEFMGVAAALRLGRVSLTAGERAEAISALEQIKERHPEQAALLESELGRLKG